MIKASNNSSGWAWSRGIESAARREFLEKLYANACPRARAAWRCPTLNAQPRPVSKNGDGV